jgi:uncharacterized phage protein (TIGR01671 family)
MPTKVMYWFDIVNGNHGHGQGYIGMALFGQEISTNTHRDNLRLVDPTDCELMQFTGLKDNNSIEVYEGDIIGSVMDSCHGNNCLIVFKDGCFCAQYKDIFRPLTKSQISNWIAIDDIAFGYDFTVKGNIHQNPELLEAVKP